VRFCSFCDWQSTDIYIRAPDLGPATIQDPQLLRLVQTAVPLVLQIASAQYPASFPVFAAEAIYLRATFSASGAYPDHVQHNPRVAFRDFEQAARAGYAQAWFRLGRDYENFNDAAHARDCFERGVKLNVESCVYLVLFSLLAIISLYLTFHPRVTADGNGTLDGPTWSPCAA
jgi:hypothetical protein